MLIKTPDLERPHGEDPNDDSMPGDWFVIGPPLSHVHGRCVFCSEKICDWIVMEHAERVMRDHGATELAHTECALERRERLAEGSDDVEALERGSVVLISVLARD